MSLPPSNPPPDQPGDEAQFIKGALIMCRACEQSFLIDAAQILMLECCCFCRAQLRSVHPAPTGDKKERVQ